MRHLSKAGLAALLIALAVAVAVVAGCGSSSSGSSSGTASASAGTSKAYKIGVTQIVTHPALDAAVAGFKEALAEKGFTNVTYDDQNAQGDMSTATSIAQKFAGEGLDLILGVATPTTQAVVKADQTTPIVFTAVTDPVGAGIVTNPEAPAGNVTGVSDMLPVQPHLDLIKAIVPDVKTIGVIYNAGESNSVFLIKAEKDAAAKMGVKVVDATASNSSEVQAAAQSLVGRVDAMSVLTDNTAVSALESIIKVAEQNKIPLIAGDTDSVKRGAVAAYAFDYKDLGKQAGYQAAEILNGTPIKDIPVEYAKNLQLSINEKAAAAMGVTIPSDLAAKAQNKF
ncbi:MAG TPA: ABC transporter substrate-binding protein [Thermoleophilia bacterium]|nr:ABC transporter substrate-binding protein [Thermoleophilia bacterium]